MHDLFMEIIRIPKGNGRFRVVYNPDPEHKRRLRTFVPQLNWICEKMDTHGVQHGAREGRSPVSNAKVHIGFEYTLSMDLEGFFDTVTKDLVIRSVTDPGTAAELPPLEDCFHNDIAVQGFPTSPALANMAATPMDHAIMDLIKPDGRFETQQFVYTRYIDDLTFSSNRFQTILWLQGKVPEIARQFGFKVNEAKTKVQCAKSGRRIITGVAVGPDGIHRPRELKRRLRAGQHQEKYGMRRRLIRRLLFRSGRLRKRRPLRYLFHCQLRGLKEWASLKAPSQPPERKATGKVKKAAVKIMTAVLGKNTTSKIQGLFRRAFDL